MDVPSTLVASSAIIALITVLILNYHWFNSLERRMEVMERGLMDFYKLQAEQDKQITRLKDHTGLK